MTLYEMSNVFPHRFRGQVEQQCKHQISPFINRLKILECATNRDSLLPATLRYNSYSRLWNRCRAGNYSKAPLEKKIISKFSSIKHLVHYSYFFLQTFFKNNGFRAYIYTKVIDGYRCVFLIKTIIRAPL